MEKKLYRIWSTMHNNLHTKSPDITICERWNQFDNFLTDMGSSFKDGLMFVRKDESKGYYPDNCVFATKDEYHSKIRPKKVAYYNGKHWTVKELALEFGMGQKALRHRLNLNWDIDRIKNTPVRGRIYYD